MRDATNSNTGSLLELGDIPELSLHCDKNSTSRRQYPDSIIGTHDNLSRRAGTGHQIYAGISRAWQLRGTAVFDFFFVLLLKCFPVASYNGCK